MYLKPPLSPLVFFTHFLWNEKVELRSLLVYSSYPRSLDKQRTCQNSIKTHKMSEYRLKKKEILVFRGLWRTSEWTLEFVFWPDCVHFLSWWFSKFFIFLLLFYFYNFISTIKIQTLAAGVHSAIGVHVQQIAVKVFVIVTAFVILHHRDMVRSFVR